MILRPYQQAAVADACKALDKHKNTIVVAPTGAGKTIMLSALIGKRHKKDKRVLVLQHRDELVAQNRAKFLKVNPYITTSIVDGTMKDWSGDAIFSMVQTLSRENNLSKRPKFDMVVIDESHHVAADTYLKVIEAVRKDNENAEVVGFTATPNRGDKKGLKNVFTNCSHQIQLATLIREGFLVPPKAYVIDVGVRGELEGVRKLASDFDMDQVEAIMNKRVINDAIVEKWRELSGDRKTVVFCSTIAHAEGVCEAFVDAGVNAKTVTGDTPKDARKQILHDLEFGDVQVVVNVAVLTEGFDAQPVSCVILTRPCSYKATMAQMIGRGLRTVDPEIHPGVIKKDCIVIDFGTSILTHGELDDAVDLDGKEANANPGESPEKQCPECDFIIPQNARECPNCGHSFSAPDKETLANFELTEVDLIGRSPFRWIDPFGTGACKMATGFNGFGIVIETAEDTCIAIVKAQGGRTRVVSIGTKMQATAAADDFLREVEDSTGANKTKRWLSQPVSDKQREHLARHGVLIGPMDYSWDRYKAACWLNYLWNRQAIDSIINKMGYTNAA